MLIARRADNLHKARPNNLSRDTLQAPERSKALQRVLADAEGEPSIKATLMKLVLDGPAADLETLVARREENYQLRVAFSEDFARSQEVAKALKELEAGKRFEEESAAYLGEERPAYEALRALTRQDPGARLALRHLLLDGRLRQAPDGTSLLAALTALRTQPLAPGLDQAALVGAVIRELADPITISQRIKGTCTVTTLQLLTVLDRPTEYVRLVAGLASPEGRVTLANGEVIAREPGTEHDDGSGRTPSSRLWQAAMMEYANGDLLYDNDQDVSTGPGVAPSVGLTMDQMDRALRGVLRPDSRSRILNRGVGQPIGELLKPIEEALRAGLQVPVSLRWGEADAQGAIHGLHAVLVTRLEADKVSYLNPWGSEESMTREAFEARLDSVILPEKLPVYLPSLITETPVPPEVSPIAPADVQGVPLEPAAPGAPEASR